MNNKNREIVRNVIKKLNDSSIIFDDINEAIEILEELKEGEVDKLDNMSMSGGLQQTFNGEEISMAARTLEECCENLKELEFDLIQEKIDEITDELNSLI